MPVAFLQFADFLPLAFNQIASELGSMYWRTDGGCSMPGRVDGAVWRLPARFGAVSRPDFRRSCAHVPGIDVMMPSSADDACGLLNTALESPRPTLFCTRRPRSMSPS